MSCYNPIPVIFKKGERPQIIDQLSTDQWNKNWRWQDKINCKKCIGCKIDYCNEWATRGQLEAKKSPNNWFITLTYNDENLPLNNYNIPTLKKEHITKFINTLRKHFERRNHTGIKYLIGGEYGTKKGRPHYHLILFNLPLNDLKKIKWKNKEAYYSPLIEKIWKMNTTKTSPNIILPANYETIQYTVRYAFKKIMKNDTEKKEIEPEKIRMSKEIGKKEFEEKWQEIYENDNMVIKTKKGGITIRPPKYFDRLLKEIEPKLLEKIKTTRIHQAETKTISEMKASKMKWTQLMGNKQKNCYSKLKKLKYNLKNNN